MQKKILITGGTGFLGKNLSLFLKKKFKVFISGRNINLGRIVSDQLGINYLPIDISNFTSSYNVINKIRPSIIIHSAASKYVDVSENFPDECIDTNVIGSSNIYKISKLVNCKKLIVISSDKASPPYTTIYGLSKAVMERQLILNNLKSKMQMVILRFGNLAWSTGSVFRIWEEMEKSDNLIQTTGPYMTRFFYKVSEASKLINYVINNTKRFNNSIIIPKLKSARMIDFLKEWKKIKGTKWKIIKKRPMDKDYESLISNYEMNLTKVVKTNIGQLYQIKNFYDQVLSKKSLNSQNSSKLNRNEIRDIILNKPKLL